MTHWLTFTNIARKNSINKKKFELLKMLFRKGILWLISIPMNIQVLKKIAFSYSYSECYKIIEKSIPNKYYSYQTW